MNISDDAVQSNAAGIANQNTFMFFFNFTSSYLQQGYNVLYITLEIAEELIAQRIDANLMNMKMADVSGLTKDSFLSKIDRIRQKTIGELKIKQYPPASVNINHFRALLNELSLKKNFTPDVIIVDYLGICLSARVKSAENSYNYYKSVAEEIRGLAVERQIPIISNHQFNRSGQYCVRSLEPIENPSKYSKNSFAKIALAGISHIIINLKSFSFLFNP